MDGARWAVESGNGGEDRTPDDLQCHLGGCSKQDRLLHPPGLRMGSSAWSSFVLFVSFVVKQFCASARVLAFDPFSLVTHAKQQRALITDHCLAFPLFPEAGRG